MMLASPLVPQRPFSPVANDDHLSFRPARDVDSFNSLLPPPIEFVEGSSSGALAVPEGKYQPINASPKLGLKDRTDNPSLLSSKSAAPPVVTTASANASSSSLQSVNSSTSTLKSTSTGASANSSSVQPTVVNIDLSWPDSCDRGSGLHNVGNTCFLNSALQCLLHTPPLLRMVLAHGKGEKCKAAEKFCMVCNFRQVVVQAHKTNAPFKPSPITTRLQTIAKHMRHGRQEDSHEFLRYAIDAMQKSLLHGLPPKLEAKLSETTWIYKIFGGKLRSRVSCRSCGHNSDTVDRILDLSVDIMNADSLKEALRGFIAPDFLKGADKYKCEKCKKHVNAEKRFTIHDAPAVLTVHLKRFSPLGRKMGHYIAYEETLHLQPYMSKESFGPTYSLYGVICHAGGGPNSGHYFAFVKSRTGRWFEMNDEMVSPISGPPVNKKNAYILFYIRNKGQGMQALLRDVNGVGAVDVGEKEKKHLIAGMKKRREREDEEDEDVGERVNLDEEGEVVPGKGKGKEKGFIGPLLPSAILKSNGTPDVKRAKFEHHGIFGSSNGVVKEKNEKGKKDDPQAEKLKQKISALREAKAKKALAVLDSYKSSGESGSDADEDEVMEEVGDKGKQKEEDSEIEEDEGSSPAKPPPSSPVSNPTTKTSNFKVLSSPISTTNFYGPPKRAPLRRPNPTSSSVSADSDNDNDNDDNEQHPSTPSRALLKKERKKQLKQKLRMSMGDGLSSSGGKSGRGYVNPFSRIGSENASGGSKGIINTYGKRKNRRPRGL